MGVFVHVFTSFVLIEHCINEYLLNETRCFMVLRAPNVFLYSMIIVYKDRKKIYLQEVHIILN